MVVKSIVKKITVHLTTHRLPTPQLQSPWPKHPGGGVVAVPIVCAIILRGVTHDGGASRQYVGPPVLVRDHAAHNRVDGEVHFQRVGHRVVLALVDDVPQYLLPVGEVRQAQAHQLHGDHEHQQDRVEHRRRVRHGRALVPVVRQHGRQPDGQRTGHPAQPVRQRYLLVRVIRCRLYVIL